MKSEPTGKSEQTGNLVSKNREHIPTWRDTLDYNEHVIMEKQSTGSLSLEISLKSLLDKNKKVLLHSFRM